MCDIDMLCDCCKEDTFELSKRVGCSFHIALGWLVRSSKTEWVLHRYTEGWLQRNEFEALSCNFYLKR